jgi:predicted AlkP superfamily phosphohydrolase/phosphomutase
MDPAFVERHWNDLPHLDALRRRGEFKRLATTAPPQSPVAWSTFATGLNPAGHGIYDFVHRDPSSMQPFSSLAETGEPRRFLSLGPWRIPLDRGAVRSFRRGRAFWEILGSRGVPVQLLRLPATYPAPHFQGTLLAGMGVPDLRGTFGTFTLYTDNSLDISRDVPGGRIVRTNLDGNTTVLEVEGPPNSLRQDRRMTALAMTVEVDPTEPVARFSVPGRQFILRQGEWSGWVRVRFPLIPALAHTSGMFRIYAAELHPEFRLYVSPVNLDPDDPALPISWPADYSRTLARDLGPFYTQGIREDTSALRENVLTLDEYLAQSRAVFREDLALLRRSLRRFTAGLLFFYFSAIDQNSHVLWGAHEPELLATYRDVDAAVGEIIERAPDATLLVMSDHGFTAFNRAFNLNTWLMEYGYLALDNPQAAGSEELFAHVDWSRTSAYALGLNCLYLNLAGRERAGRVQPGTDASRLLDRISSELVAARDSQTGARIVPQVSRPATALSKFAPDLIVGYAPGYRASWGAALGAVEPAVVQPNEDAWIGDHCVDPAAVPGVLFANRTSSIPDPELKDLAVTLLHLFGVAPEPAMTGRAIY